MNKQIKIREATDQDSNGWDEFVKSNKGSFYQCYKWRFVYEEQGFKAFYLIANDEKDSIKGVFPFVKIPMFINNSIHSMPFGGASGGPLSENTEVVTALMKRMDEICIREKAVYAHILVNPYKDNTELIKRCRSIGYKPRYTVDKLPSIFVLDANDYNTVWKKSFNRKVRNQIRKARKSGVEIIRDDWHLLDEYYSILIESSKKLKTRIMEEKIFYKILNVLRDYISLYIAVYKDKPIAGIYSFDFQNIRYLFNNVSLPEYVKYCPNNLLFNEIIKDGCKKSDIDIIDFGSTAPNSSHFHWKKQYGGTPVPLQYYEKIYSPVKKLIREKTVIPRVMIRRLIWSKLVSQEQANKISPKMRRFLEWF
ncbi:MAG: peptidoglycan bridge formation glycyltransferase FemA/FemB family protein [bacterium]